MLPVLDAECLKYLMVDVFSKCFETLWQQFSIYLFNYLFILLLVQLVHGLDVRSLKLGNEILKEASNKNLEVEKYDFKYFPHIPIRKVALPFPFHPLIVLLSRKLLDYIWSTPNKDNFINDITGYSENIVHIWVGELDEKQVRVYSSYLLNRNQIFHIIREKEFLNYGEKWFQKVYELLSGKATFPLQFLCDT